MATSQVQKVKVGAPKDVSCLPPRVWSARWPQSRTRRTGPARAPEGSLGLDLLPNPPSGSATFGGVSSPSCGTDCGVRGGHAAAWVDVRPGSALGPRMSLRVLTTA
jgi:hypothetical protein